MLCRVYAKVVADLMHPGHVRFFRGARVLGTHLTVCVVPDGRVAAFKGRPPLFSTEERVEMVSSCRWVDAVITDGPRITTMEFMQEHGFDLYAFGGQDENELRLKRRECEQLPDSMCVAIPYTRGVSSSVLRERIGKLITSENAESRGQD